MSLRAAVLGLLAEGPATGYDLVREFDTATSVVWPAPKGEIYRELARLAADGCVRPDAATGARGQRRWRITSKGRARLDRWLQDRSDYALRYEPMLKAVFLGELEAPDIAQVVQDQRAIFEAELAKLRAYAAAPPSAHKTRRRFALPMVTAFYEAMVAWCDEADRIIAAPPASSPPPG